MAEAERDGANVDAVREHSTALTDVVNGAIRNYHLATARYGIGNLEKIYMNAIFKLAAMKTKLVKIVAHHEHPEKAAELFAEEESRRKFLGSRHMAGFSTGFSSLSRFALFPLPFSDQVSCSAPFHRPLALISENLSLLISL